ncbi:MAG: trigger factor [Rhodanobacteraceae bacterium]
MHVSVENLGTLGRKLTVRIPADNLETTVRTRIQEMGRNARLKGFRPGKVPPKVIEQRFGKQIRNEALSEMINSSFQEVVAQEKLRPAIQPAISTSGTPDNGEIEYTATFEVMPELDQIDVSSLDITRTRANVEDADIDRMIETLRLQRRGWNQVERPAGIDDMVLFEYTAQGSGFRHPESGSDRVGSILGSGALFSEFENKLVGHATGDEFDLELVFPADFRVALLAGRTASVHVRIMRVQEPHLPDVDEAFASSFGVKQGGMAQFRADVRANLERELNDALTARLKQVTIHQLMATHPDLDLPQGMVENEARALAQQANPDAADAFDSYLPTARERVAAGLLLAEVARQNDIRVDTRRVSQALAVIASTYEEPEKVVELYSRDPQIMGGLRNRVLEDQVVEWIAEHADVSEQTLSFNEVMRPGA